MAYPSDVQRWEFNDIEASKIYAYEIGKVLRNQLGKLMVEATNYYPDGAVVEGSEYSVDLDIISVEDNSIINIVPTYTAQAGDGVTEVLEGLAQWVTNDITIPASDYLITNVYTDYPYDSDKRMFFVAKSGYYTSENSKLNLESDPKREWVPSDQPASYVGYGKAPAAEFPRLVVTPIVTNTVCDRMEESVMLVEGVETEYTSSYIDYSFNLTVEAGDTDSVLRSGISAQSILNTLKKNLVNEKVKKHFQNELNSVYHPIEDITSLPLLAETQYMDIARSTSTWSCVDILFPVDTSGFVEQVNVEAGDPQTEEGTLYKYEPEGETVIYSDPMVIDRRTV